MSLVEETLRCVVGVSGGGGGRLSITQLPR